MTYQQFRKKDKEPASQSQPVMRKGTNLEDNRVVQRKSNNTGLPDNLKTGIENLSGHSMDDVKVHYNSVQPAQLNAHAFAQGNQIHIAPGQEKHLPHEAWHVVQQKQGRVRPTRQLKANVNVNDDKQLEKEADVMGNKALQATPVTHIDPSSIPTPLLPADPLQRKNNSGNRKANTAKKVAPNRTIQRSATPVQFTEQDAYELAKRYCSEATYSSMNDLLQEKYMFTEEEWSNIVNAYNSNNTSGARLRMVYDAEQYIGRVETRIQQEAVSAGSIQKVQELAKRYLDDAASRPGVYAQKVAKMATKVIIVAAATAITHNPLIGAGVGAALDSPDHLVTLQRAKVELASGRYKAALSLLASIGLGLGSRALGGEGYSVASYVATGGSVAVSTIPGKSKTE